MHERLTVKKKHVARTVPHDKLNEAHRGIFQPQVDAPAEGEQEHTRVEHEGRHKHGRQSVASAGFLRWETTNPAWWKYSGGPAWNRPEHDHDLAKEYCGEKNQDPSRPVINGVYAQDYES